MSEKTPLLPPPPERKLLTAPPPPPKKRIHPWKIGLIAAAVLLAIFLIGYLPRHNRDKAVAATAEQESEALPTSNVTQVKLSTPISNLLLPGDTTPFEEAYIFARATGYVRHRYVDIGDHVHEGQLMADIDAPDLDAQVAQGRATVAQAEQQVVQSKAALENSIAQQDLAKVTWERYKVLVNHGAVSRQDADTQEANYKTTTANVHLQEAGVHTAEENVRAARANLDRLIALQGFEQVRAPFTGVVTARNFDVGAFINGGGASSTASGTSMGGTQTAGQLGNAGANGSPAPQANIPSSSTDTGTPAAGSGGELFRVAQIDRLRVLVNVPQENAPTVRAGQSASIMVREYAGRQFGGRVSRTSQSIDPTTRTLLTEVLVPNPKSLLLPGMYAQVQFADNRPSPPLLVPGDAVIATSNGLEVAILQDLTPDDRKQLEQRLQPKKKLSGKEAEQQRKKTEQEIAQAKKIAVRTVQVGRDYGTETEISAGLQAGETVIVNPGDETREGAFVLPRAAPPVQGEGAPQSQGQMQGQAGGIGSPSMAAPTIGSQQKQQGGQRNGKSTGKNGKGDKK